MHLGSALVPLGILWGARAAQPESQPPVEAPLRELPWGQLNFLHTTDTHGWLAGHLQEPQYGADWGDYVSFTEHLRRKADAEGVDLLLVDTGDRVDGNGLYDGSKPKGKYTRDIFSNQHIDIMTTGNHELYQAETSEYEWNEQTKNFNYSYIASNLDYVKDDGSRVPMAPRFRKLTTPNQGIRILAFGFIFDFNMNSNRTVVQKVDDTIKEDWFQEAIRDKEVDLFVVAGHVALSQLEYKKIYDAIRQRRWDTPIQFFAGHAHVRGYRKFDNKAHAIASGRYFETIGFQSISGLATGGAPVEQRDDVSLAASPDFGRRYIDNNLFSLQHHSGTNASTFATSAGKAVSAQITAARHAMGLDKLFGCNPRTLWLNRVPYPHQDSLFSWLGSRVLPERVVQAERAAAPRIVIANTGAMRFDLFRGRFSRDSTYMLSPFPGSFRFIPDVPFRLADRVTAWLNSQSKILAEGFHSPLQEFPAAQAPHGPRLLPEVGQRAGGQVPLVGADYQGRADGADYWGQGGDGEKPALTPGYVTRDEMGDDGDDTLHSPIDFFPIPNVIESRVNTTAGEGDETPVDRVDLVFLEFIQPFVLQALRFLGGEYAANETQPYISRDLNTIITDWVEDNWAGGDC